MSGRLFYVIGIADHLVRNCLNAMRLLAEPSSKGDAHITIRGPYERKINVKPFERIVAGTTVSVIGAGSFFCEGQSTVFLRCGFPEIEMVWHKPNYVEINAHITIYDGKDRDFASTLLSHLSFRRLYFSFPATKLMPLRSLPGQTNLDLRMSIDLGAVERAANVEIDWRNIHLIGYEQRFIYIDAFADFLKNELRGVC